MTARPMAVRLHPGRGATGPVAALVLVGALTAGCGASGSSPAAASGSAAAPSTPAGQSDPATAQTPSGGSTGDSSSPSPSPSPSPSLSSPSPTASSPAATASGPALLRRGAHGPQVRALQERLIALGYWLGTADGSYGDLTAQAVLALQKAAGISRDGVVGPQTRAALGHGVRPGARSRSGHVMEVDLRHQLLLVVDDGVVRLVLNTSTGSGAWYTAPDGHRAHAVTPPGTFRVQRQVDGWHTSPLGQLWRPKYFNSGIAVHGYTSVPAYPASHGCVRVSIPAMNMIWNSGLMPIGTTVRVY